MAVVDIEERPQRPGGFSKGYIRKYKRVFRVLTDDERDSTQTVAYAVPVAIGDSYVSFGNWESDPLALCIDVDPQPAGDDAPLIWIVTCTFECSVAAPFATPSQNQKPGQGGDPDDPTQWAPKRSWSYGSLQLPLRKAFDLGGNNNLTLPVTNSAGYPFRNLPPRTVKFSILTFTRFENSFSRNDHVRYADAVNAAGWNGLGWGKALLSDWQIEDVYIGQSLFFRHTRVIWFCPSALPDWFVRILDCGTRDKNGNQILDPKTRLEVDHDWPLDGNGMPLSANAIFNGSQVYGKFPDHPTMPFEPFNIVV